MVSQIDLDVQKFQEYRNNDYSIAVAIGALCLRLIESGSGGSDGGSSATLPTANFIIAEVGNGTIPAGAKYATFAIPPGGTGTIQGTAYTDELQQISFPVLTSGYDAIAYEVTAGSLYITYAI
ncbi:MAG: hypothetical protein QNJ72_31345 [Pleurocapsa sp. MO_226.B13]|nr:hypothetical protein [Pleurocapsa sp. MO_226.B13]